MKKLLAVVIIFVACLLAVAVWYSPLCALGTPTAYYDNRPTAELKGLCYPPGEVCRVDFCGTADDMYAALDAMDATVVKTETTDGLVIAYAYSKRVCAAPQRLSDGREYNVMAAVTEDGDISVGTPVLSGCY